MRKLGKSFLSVLMLTLFLGVMPLAAAQTGNVYDNGDLLTSDEAQSLNNSITDVENSTGWNIYMLTTNDVQGKSSKDYADDFYDEAAPDTDGVVLLLDMDNRVTYLSTSGDDTVVRYLTDARIDAITEEASSYAGDGDYAQCLQIMLDGVEHYYEAGIPSGQTNYDTETGKYSKYRSITPIEAVIAVVIALAAGAIVYLSIVGKYCLKFGTYHYDGHRDGGVELRVDEDRFINQFVTHHHIQRDNGGSNGGGGNISSTHTSSGGHSHGGGGHGF